MASMSVAQDLTVTKTDNALANLRLRALDLHARMLELRDAVSMLRDGVGPARNAPWSVFLAKYETLAKLFRQLTEELDRAVTEVGFHNFVLRPVLSLENPEAIPSMLRTKLEPSVEKDVDDLRQQCAHDMGGDEQPVLTEALQKRIVMYNSFVEGALERFEELKETLIEGRVPTEQETTPSSANAQALLSALATGGVIPG